MNDGAAGQIKPANSLVRGSDENIWIISPADEFDGALVNTFANFKPSRGRDGDWATRVGARDLGEVKNTQLLLHAASSHEIRIVRRISNGTDDVVMLQREQELTGMSVPDFAMSSLLENVHTIFKQDAPWADEETTYAVKSADAVAALEASGLNLACQTAPLCPMKVPILVTQN